MSLDVRKLQNLYKTDAISRAIIDSLALEGAAQVSEVAELGGEFENVLGFAGLDEKKRELAVIRALKAIHQTGCGTLIAGSSARNSRISWELEPEEIYAFATGAGQPLVEVEVATLPQLTRVQRPGPTARQRPRDAGGR